MLVTLPSVGITEFLHPKIKVPLATSIKQFSIGYYSKSGASYMPMVKLVPTAESGKGGKSAPTMSKTDPNGGGGASQKGGEGGSSGEQQLVIYDASTAVLFNKGYKTVTLEGDQALCYSMLYKGVTEAVFTIPTVDDDGKQTSISISVHKLKNKLTLEYNGEKPTLKGEVKAWLKVSDVDASESIGALSTLGNLNGKVLYDSEQFIKNNLNKELSLVVEEFDGEYTIGYTENYIKVYVLGEIPNGKYKVILKSIMREGAYAEIKR